MPSLLCRKPDMIKNLKTMLCESNLNFVISDCNYILNQDSNIFSLAIQLMYSISTHIEFNKSIRFDFLEIITNLLKIDNSVIKIRKLEFIKDIFESFFAFSNLFFISNKSSGDLSDFSIDHEKIIKILEHLYYIATKTNLCSEKILIHKSIIMLILTLDEIIIDDGKTKAKIDDSCTFHQMNPQHGISLVKLEFINNLIKKSIKHGPILNLPTFKIFKVDTNKNQFRHRIKSSKIDELPMTEFISPTVFLKNTISKKKSISLSEPCLHKINKIKEYSSKSCLQLAVQISKIKVEEPQNKPPTPIVIIKREAQTQVTKTINNKEVTIDRNVRLKIPPKNINPQRNLSTNEKIKREDISINLVGKFFEEFGDFFRQLIKESPSNFIKVDRQFQKFADSFLEKIFDQTSKINMKSFFDLYAEDIYYCAIFILILSNHVENVITFDFDEFYESNFYQLINNNQLLVDFKKNVVKQLLQTQSFLVSFRIPDECQMLKNFLHQTSTLILPVSQIKHQYCNNDKNKIDESILEFLNKMYSELYEHTTIMDNSEDSWEWESDIRLELMCLLSLLCAKMEFWKIYDNLSKFITEMSLIQDQVDQRISISKTAAIQTIVSCSWSLINTCCQKSSSWDNTFMIFSEIVKLRESDLQNSNLIKAVDSDTSKIKDLENNGDIYSCDFLNTNEKIEESYLSMKNTKDVIKYMYTYVEDFFKAVKSNNVLKDTANILTHLYEQAQKENHHNVVSLSSEFLFDCYTNIIMEKINIKFYNQIFIKSLTEEIANSLINLTLLDYGYDHNITTTSVYEFLVSFLAVNSRKCSRLVTNNYIMTVFIRKLIEHQKEHPNIVIDLLSEMMINKSHFLGSSLHSFVNFMWEILKEYPSSTKLDILFQKMSVIINKIPSAIQNWISAIPEIIIHSLSLIDYIMDIRSETNKNQECSKSNALVYEIQNMIGVLIDSNFSKLVKDWKIIKFHMRKGTILTTGHSQKTSDNGSQEVLQDQQYFKWTTSGDSIEDYKGFYDVFSSIIDILQDAYLKNIKSANSNQFVKLYEKLINLPEFQKTYFIHISIHGYIFLEKIFNIIDEIKCYDESFVSVKQLSFLFSDFLVLMFNQKFEENYDYTDLMSGMIEKYLKLFSFLSRFEDESYSKLGCSCFRHILKKFCEYSTGEKFLAHLNIWKIIINFLCQNIEMALKNFQNLISCFSPSSINVQGDIFRIKLIEGDSDDYKSKKDKSNYIINSARQIFQTDDQLEENSDNGSDINTNFIIVGMNLVFQSGSVNNQELFRFEIVKMLNELTVNQVMLELTDFLMNFMLNEVINVFYNRKTTVETKKKSVREIMYSSSLKNNSQKTINSSNQADIVEFLKELKNFFIPLRTQWELGLSLESRPGLKFLIQRIYGLKYPANLIKLSTTSFSSFLTFLLRLCCFDVSLTSSCPKSPKIEPQKVSPLSRNVKNIKEPLSKSPPVPIRSQIKAPTNNTKTNIQELKNMFSLLCDIIEALQGDFIKSSDGNDSDIKNADIDIWRNNLAALQDLSNMDLSKEGETWKTTIGSENDWILEKNRQITSWIEVLRNLLEFLLQQSNPQFKVILPAVFKPLSSLIAAARDPKSQKMLSEVIMKCGVVYGIV